MSSSRKILYTYLTLFVAVICAYSHVANCNFISLDDTGYVVQNSFVRTGLNLESIRTAFGSFLGSLWIPLVWISFMVDVSLFGLNPAAFHIENLLLHAAATLLLLHGLHRATGRLWPSAIVAALFGLHPINVESVAWITERKNVLCGLFWILSMNAYLRYGATGKCSSYGWALGWFVLALMSKPMAVTLPGTLFLLDLWPLRRNLSRWPWLLIEKLPFVVLSIVVSFVAMQASRVGDPALTYEEFPLWPRVSNALVSYGLYLRDFVWPAELAALYPHTFEAEPFRAAVSLTTLLVITTVALWLVRTRPYLLVGWLWFLGVLVPMLGFVQLGVQSRADRFTYIAQIGIFIAVVWWLADLWSGRRKAFVSAITLTVLATFAVQTAAEVRYWTNSLTILERAIENTEPNFYGRVFAGRAWAHRGENARAAEHFEVALRIQSAPDDVWRDYGRLLNNLNRPKEAVQALSEAVRINPTSPETRSLLAQSYVALEQDEAAIMHFSEAVRLDSKAIEPRESLGRLLQKSGRGEEATRFLQEAEHLRSENGTK